MLFEGVTMHDMQANYYVSKQTLKVGDVVCRTGGSNSRELWMASIWKTHHFEAGHLPVVELHSAQHAKLTVKGIGGCDGKYQLVYC